MGSIDYTELYQLQDEILKIIFAHEDMFYLTGGTCLGRFYHEKRYSDDLDFFADNEPRFNLAVKNIKLILQKDYLIKTETDSKDFIRIKVENLLQIDFVNDRVFRFGELKFLEGGIILDNIENILANKITAIIGRDNPKDIFDVYLISKFYDLNFNDILKISHKKTKFDDADLIIRLKSFPVKLLEDINLIDEDFLNNFEKEFPVIIEKIIAGMSNG